MEYLVVRCFVFVLSACCYRAVIVLSSYCHREGVKCLQNLLEGDDMKWHCLLSFASKLRHALFIVAASIVIVSGVERLVRQCKPQYIIALFTVYYKNMSLVAESNDWFVNAISKHNLLGFQSSPQSMLFSCKMLAINVLSIIDCIDVPVVRGSTPLTMTN